MSFALYILLFLGALVAIGAAAAAAGTPTRACLNCGHDTPVQRPRCRRCGYTSARSI